MPENPSFQDQLDDLRRDALARLAADVSDVASVEAWNRDVLGPKGLLTTALRSLAQLDAAERPAAGKAANAVKAELVAAFAARRAEITTADVASRLTGDGIDMTLPGREPRIGTVHPISAMIDEVSDILAHLGFETVFGTEIETERYNFDLLNIPADHPARDVWDTIFVEPQNAHLVLRTHTSPMQARIMERRTPPIRVIVPGRTYRFEAQDASHEWMFHQIEGLAIDRHTTLTDLKGVLQELARQLFGSERKIRFRCDFFPFVEPGVDFAVDCAVCGGKGCRVCKHTGWLEMGGAGMVHPAVLEGAGIDPDEYQGWAFGLGVERLVMMRYGIKDIRAFAGNDLRFLAQFTRQMV